MATSFFSLYTSFSLILLLLLSLTTGDLLRTDAAALNDVCSQTNQPRRCLTLIVSSGTRSKTAGLPELGQIAIVAATGAAGDVKIKVHMNLMLSARNPKLKSLYRNCENLYRSALDQLLIAPEYLQKRAYSKLVAAAGVVGGGVRGCSAAVGNNGGLNQENEDTGILADAIAVIAKKLTA